MVPFVCSLNGEFWKFASSSMHAISRHDILDSSKNLPLTKSSVYLQ